MRYKLTGDLKIWNITNFIEEVNGTLISHNTARNITKEIILDVKSPIKKSLLKEYGLKSELIDEDPNKFIREKIINILHREGILLPIKEAYYLKDMHGYEISFNISKEINIVWNDYFGVFIQNKKVYAESIGEHTINDAWISRLRKTIRLRDIFKEELEDIL